MADNTDPVHNKCATNHKWNFDMVISDNANIASPFTVQFFRYTESTLKPHRIQI